MAGALPTEFQLQLAYRQFQQRALPREEAKRIARLSKRIRKKKEKVKLAPMYGPRRLPRAVSVKHFAPKRIDDVLTAFLKATTDIPRTRCEDEPEG